MAFLPLYFPTIPFETAKAAWGAFGRKNFYLAIGDQANILFDGIHLVDHQGLFPKPPHTLAMLYLITIFQYAELLSDSQAERAVLERSEWKYALHVPMNFTGLAAESLCEFRRWLVIEPTAQHSLQMLIQRLSEAAHCPTRMNPNLEASQVIYEVCQTSRLAKIWDALNKAMEALQARYPDWLSSSNLPHWYERYSNPYSNLNLGADRLERHALIHQTGADSLYLVKAVSESQEPDLVNIPAITNLKQTWTEQYEQIEGKVVWRREACSGCSLYSLMPLQSINSEYDIHR